MAAIHNKDGTEECKTYSPSVLPYNVTDSEHMYIQKLQRNIHDLQKIKEEAVKQENYGLAEQTRKKLNVLEVQLTKMEHQLNADMITNCIGHWQNKLAEGLVEKIENGDTSQSTGITSAYPLRENFHISFLMTIDRIPNNYIDSLIKAVLIILPHTASDIPKSPFGYDFFLKKVTSRAKKNYELNMSQQSMIKWILTVAVTDVLIHLTERYNGKNISRDTRELILKHGFFYFKISSLRKTQKDTLEDPILLRWAIILGDLALTDRSSMIKMMVQVLDPNKKINNEEIVNVLNVMRYIFVKPKNDKEAMDILYLIHELEAFIERHKKTSVRIAIIQTLERIIQPFNYWVVETVEKEHQNNYESALWSEMIELFRKAKRWLTMDELKECSLKLITVILINSKIDFYASNIEGFIAQDLFPKNKVKNYIFSSVLQLLRGQYFEDSKPNSRAKLNDTFTIAPAWGFLTRPVTEESAEAVTNRLQDFSERLFIRRKTPIPQEYLDICVSIVLQMAAQNLYMTLKSTITCLLDTSSQNFDNYYIAIRALNVISDAESGFAEHAICRYDERFNILLDDIPADFEQQLVRTIQMTEFNVGIQVLGKSHRVLEPIPFWEYNDQDKEELDYESLYGKLEDFYSINNVENANLNTNNMLTVNTLGRNEHRDRLNDSQWYSLSRISSVQQGSRRFTAIEEFNNNNNNPTSTSPHGPNANNANNANNTSTTGLEKVSKREAANKNVQKALTHWCEARGVPPSNIPALIKLPISNTQTRYSKASSNSKKSKSEPHNLISKLFIECVRLIPFMPAPELVSGPYCIANYLIHSMEDIACEVSFTLQKMFARIPETRLGIIKGFVNLLKRTEHQDDVSICTILTHLDFLLKMWVNKDMYAPDEPINDDDAYRISCKLDAAMMVMMARESPRIRMLAYEILTDFNEIQKVVCNSLELDNEVKLPLATILEEQETVIARQGMYGFLEKDLYGYIVTPKMASVLTIIHPKEVAASDYSYLYKYYLGESARQFVNFGRVKALRQCAKFLMVSAIPYITAQSMVDSEYITAYNSYMVLLMALAGVPDNRTTVMTFKPVNSSEGLLFHVFRTFLYPILSSDVSWEIKALNTSTYFTHPSVIKMMINQIWGLFVTNSSKRGKSSSHLLDDIISFLRYTSQNTYFDELINELPQGENQHTVLDIYLNALNASISLFESASFISNKNIPRIKTAINFVTIIQRLSETLIMTNKWDNEQRVTIMKILREWYFICQDVINANLNSGSSNHDKYCNNCRKLYVKIGQAMEKFLEGSDPFNGDSIPHELIVWMTRMERNGFQILSPCLKNNYENVLGTVLAHSYSNKNSQAILFSEAIFDLVLPKQKITPSTFLDNKDSGIYSCIEKYIAILHNLPQPDNNIFTLYGSGNAKEDDELIVPEITDEFYKKLRQRCGSLIFFGLYNMLHVSKSIRLRALLFVKKLFTLFNPNKEMDMEGYFGKFSGRFYSNVGHVLKSRVLELSELAAKLFPEDSGNFIWEAIRCSRSIQKQEGQQTLIFGQTWILNLIRPWCHFIDMDISSKDVVSQEFFKFLMDITFYYKPASAKEDIYQCWTDIASSEAYGESNTGVLVNALINVCGRFEHLKDTCIVLMSKLLEINPDILVEITIQQLSSASFPWRKQSSNINKNSPSSPNSKEAKQPIVEFCNTLASNIKYPDNGGTITKNYTACCKASCIFLSEILLQNFQKVIGYFPIILNYLFLYLPVNLKEKSVTANLLSSLIEGYTFIQHQRGNLQVKSFEDIHDQIRKMLVNLDMITFKVIWSNGNVSELTENPQCCISIYTFVNSILSIFAEESSTLTQDLANEAIDWALDSFIGYDLTIRAFELYYTYIDSNREVTITNAALDGIHKCLCEHVNILADYEMDIQHKGISWTTANENPQPVLNDSTNIIDWIVKIEKVAIEIYSENDTLKDRGELFWIPSSLLNLPITVFRDIYSNIIDCCLLYISKCGFSVSAREPKSIYDIFSSIRGFVGIQPLLVQGLFCEKEELQNKLFIYLGEIWNKLPVEMVDASPLGFMYYVLYSATFIFGRIIINPDWQEDNVLSNVIANFCDVLSNNEIFSKSNTLRYLKDFISHGGKPEEAEEILDQFTYDFASVYLPKYIGNIVSYFMASLTFASMYLLVVLRMSKALWDIDKKRMIPFKPFYKKLGFYLENNAEVEDVFLFIFKDDLVEQKEFIFNIDLSDQGVNDSEPVVSSITYSIKTISNILDDIGYKRKERRPKPPPPPQDENPYLQN
ncbi:hypothetical protein BCR32DRAFT_281580 [Anaeromyces robustus]|uniref:Cell morphogenesis protein N-terminal domain-containing protein n=1 Tax=Anaeromyces robustus TaxID=1754192 RepID=A0A1Y1X0L4_9FUNG|nr:hypothetical protein BCR32DRAFT_281580 [Anaeromyces robustus]|eukprot:ORX79205.1 hypothetical protein BCR32DRAFT_281580 [Anaeromyces robustus]